MKKVISFVIPCLLILGMYKSPIPKVDLGTFVICILIVCIFVYLKSNYKKIVVFKKKNTINILVFYCFFMLVGLMYSMLTNQLNVTLLIIISRIIKFWVVVFFLSLIINNELFDYEYSFKVLKKIVKVSIVFLIIQYISFYIFHKSIYGVAFKFILQGDYESVDYSTLSRKYLYRPSALFLEPSGVSNYFSLCLAFLLNQKINKKNIIFAVCVTIGMIMTTSGQAFLYSSVIWGIFFIVFLFKSATKKNIIYFCVILFLLILLLPKIYQIPIIEKAILRITDGSKAGGNAIEARTFSYAYFINLDTINKIIGMGFGNPIPNMYFSSLAYTLYCVGIVGLMIILYFYYKLFRIKCNKIFLIQLLVSMFFTTPFVALNICYHLPFLYFETQNNKK